MPVERILGRVGGTLAGAGAVALLMMLASGGEGGWLPIPLVLILFAVVLGPWVAGRLPRRAVADRWTAVPAFQPAPAHLRSSPRAVALALARPEARELALSPAFGAGLAFCATVVVLFGFVWPADNSGDLAEVAELMPIFVHPLVGMVVLAAHRARTRSVRDGTEELFGACPATPATRTAGHLITAWLPVVVTAVFAPGMVLLVRAHLDAVWGPFGARQVVAILSAVVLAVGGVALGVALARWAPWTIAPVVAVVAVGFAAIRLATAGGGDEREPLRQLSTFLGDSEIDYRFTAPHYLARLGWLFALVVLVTIVGVLRDRRTVPLFAGGVAVAVAAAGFAVATARPIDAADAERIAAVLNDVPGHQDCLDAGGIDVCTFRGDDDLARLIRDEVAPVAAAVPAGALDGHVLRAGAATEARYLDPEVVQRLDGETDPGVVPAVIAVHREAQQAVRLWVALAAVGVVDDWRPGSSLLVAGQARGVAALWLAVRDARPSFVDHMTSFDDNPGPNSIATRPWPDPCYAGPPPVRWAVTDVSAVRRLLEVPDAQVLDVLHRRWAWVTDPATTSAELLAVFGEDPPDDSDVLTRSASC